MEQYYQVWMSAENTEQSQDILNTLTHKRLIVGGTILNGPSHFWWKENEIDMDYYYVMAFTTQNNIDELEKEYSNVSVEEIPMISIIEMRGNREFQKFISENVK